MKTFDAVFDKKNLNILANKSKTKSSNLFFSFSRHKQPGIPFASPIYPL